jgi:DNA helicase II / ATP-dependent DNA helicase PcrA
MQKIEQLLSGLDAEQRRAVTTPIGPLRIVAGAGTGKTRTLIHRIAYWHIKGIAPANKVLAVTFTRKSAAELRHRLEKMGIVGVSAQTFHSAAIGQLREYWKVGGQSIDFPSLLTGRDQYFAIRRAIAEALKMGDKQKEERKKVDSILQRSVMEELTVIKSKMIDLDNYLASSTFSGPKGNISKTEFVNAIRRYEEFKKNKNLIDYADALMRCIRMLENVPHVAQLIRSKYEHILVDEYQDNDPVQERLLDAWLGDRKSICVVGDPRQTIFSFKGADPTIMRDFPKKHQGTVTLELTRNYRSTKRIVEWANKMMSNTSAAGGAKAQLKPTGALGWNPQVRSYYTEKVELEQLAKRIEQLSKNTQVPYRNFAVLTRFRDDIAKVRRALSILGIPNTSPNDEFWRDVEPILRRMKSLAQDSNLLGRAALVEALNAQGWEDKSEEENQEDEYSELRGTLLELLESIPDFQGMTVDQLLGAFKELEYEAKNSTDVDAVNVMTLHQAKGLEWDAVYIPRFIEGALPTSHAKTQEQLDEERRLVYVGITRARKFLELSWGETYRHLDRAGKETTRPQTISSFATFLKEETPPAPKRVEKNKEDWNNRFAPPIRKPVPTKPLTNYEIVSGTKDTIGSVVKHKLLGEGKIVAVGSSYSVIDFGKEGRFKIDLPPY